MSYKTPLEMWYQWEEKKPNAILFRQPIDGKYIDFTWKEAGEEVRRLAAAIKAKNYPPNSKIALVSKNCAYWIMCDVAIMMAGHISVPLYPNVNAEKMGFVLEHSEAKLLFVGKLDDWDNMKAGVPKGVDCISFPKYGPKNFEQWTDLVAKHEPLKEETIMDKEAIMTIIYTSGTTGNPKGVVHRTAAFAYASSKALQVLEVDMSDGRFFSYLPLSHIAERLLVEMGCFYSGAEVWFAESLESFPKNLADTQPTVFLAVPRIWTKFQMGILGKMSQTKLNILLNIPIISGIIRKKIRAALGLTNAHTCLTGAAPTPPSLIKWYKKLGVQIQEVYGMTENCAYSHLNRKGKIKIGSAGQPMPDVEVKIDDSGEILIMSKANMVEYYKEPEKTREVFRNGFLCTGDAGHVDKNGYLFITGRVKSIFKTAKGKYVAPEPIESKLASNTNIEQICVSGSNLPQPIALVNLSEAAAECPREDLVESLSETLKEVNEQLEKHERICKFVVLNEAWSIENEMLTPTMKVKRRSIDAAFLSKMPAWEAKDGLVIWGD